MRIPNATHREAHLPIVAAPDHAAIAVVYAPAPGTVRTVLYRTPPVTVAPVTVAAYEVERTIDIETVATRKGRKAGRVIQGKVAADTSVVAVSSPVGSSSSKGFGYS